jgi:hypothetical protein
VSDQVFDLNAPQRAAETNMVTATRYGIAHVAYLLAIIVATIGWLCFIAWIALHLV